MQAQLRRRAQEFIYNSARWDDQYHTTTESTVVDGGLTAGGVILSVDRASIPSLEVAFSLPQPIIVVCLVSGKVSI